MDFSENRPRCLHLWMQSVSGRPNKPCRCSWGSRVSELCLVFPQCIRRIHVYLFMHACIHACFYVCTHNLEKLTIYYVQVVLNVRFTCMPMLFTVLFVSCCMNDTPCIRWNNLSVDASSERSHKIWLLGEGPNVDFRKCDFVLD